MHPLTGALSNLAAAHPATSVRLIAREVSFGREILRNVARTRGALAGWSATTLRQLAGELAEPSLRTAGTRSATDLELRAAADDALDATAGTIPAPLKRQAQSLGFRAAAFDAFAELRLAGISAAQLKTAARKGSPAEALAVTYDRYCTILRDQKLSDAADAFRLAVSALADSRIANALTVIEPGAADATGLPLTLVNALRTHGAEFPALNDSRPDWSPVAADVAIVRAASPALELRDALRHARSLGISWDSVELAVTDVNEYGSALASLGDELGIPYTLKEGVPMIRTRAGRSLERFLRWLEDGLPATPIRQAIEQGELQVGTADVPAADIVRALRNAQIGWGRSRWIAALDRLTDDATGVATAAVIRTLVELAPVVPEPSVSGSDGARIKTSALASIALRWLELVAAGLTSASERHALARLQLRLTELAAHDRAAVDFTLASAELRLAIADLRAFPSADGTRARRVSAPGAVHLTDTTQAGATGRPNVYVLGLDAERTSRASASDPILDDDTRAALGSAIPSLRDRSARRERALYRALNGLAGKVRLSYSTLADSAGREASPSSLLLDAARAHFREPTLSYEELRKKLGAPSGAARGNGALDRRDVWLRALASTRDLADGRAAIRAAWPRLDRGLAMHESAETASISEWNGLVAAAAGKTGPFADSTRWTSPTSLETIGKCPLQWFYRYALGLKPPEDVEFDSTIWLDARQHGSLLHVILERFVREWLPRQGDLALDDAAVALRTIVASEVDKQRATVPPPSELLFTQERERLERSARQFLAQERQHRDAQWIEVEASFPAEGATATFLTADGIKLLIGGRIDRVDRFTDGSLRVIDYKSGSSFRFRSLGAKDTPLKGGRMLQPAIYAEGARQALGAAVRAFEYRFPRERAPDDRVVVDQAMLAKAPAVVASLLSHLRDGNFIATDDSGDCSYCDYRAICHVSGDSRSVASPRAEWGKEHGENAPEYVQMRTRRTPEGA